MSKPSLVIQFNSQKDLNIWNVGPPFLPVVRKRKCITVHVLNNGKNTLSGCEAFLELKQGKTATRQIPLHWADTPYAVLSSSMQPVTINPYREHRLDIAFSEGNVVGCSIAASQALAAGVQNNQFFLSPGTYQVRITIVSQNGKRVSKDFLITSPAAWQQLSMEENMNPSLLDKWHKLNMTGPVKAAVIGLVGAIGAAFVSGIFLLISTIIGHAPSQIHSQQNNMSAVGNAGLFQQQNAGTIINSPVFSKKSSGEDAEFEKKLASGFYGYFVSARDKLADRRPVDTERVKSYLAGNRFFPLDIHTQIGNFLTSIEDANYSAAADQVRDIISKMEDRYGIKLYESPSEEVRTVSADVTAVLLTDKNTDTLSAPQQLKKDDRDDRTPCFTS